VAISRGSVSPSSGTRTGAFILNTKEEGQHFVQRFMLAQCETPAKGKGEESRGNLPDLQSSCTQYTRTLVLCQVRRRHSLLICFWDFACSDGCLSREERLAAGCGRCGEVCADASGITPRRLFPHAVSRERGLTPPLVAPFTPPAASSISSSASAAPEAPTSASSINWSGCRRKSSQRGVMIPGTRGKRTSASSKSMWVSRLG
jgi:hypothetical protein